MKNSAQLYWTRQSARMTVSHESLLIARALTGDIDARNQVAVAYLPLIRSLARRIIGKEAFYELSDISNYGCTVLIEQFHKYQPENGSIATFIENYIFPLMRSEVLRLQNIIRIPFGTKIEITEDGIKKSVRSSSLLFEYLRLSQGSNSPSVHDFLEKKGAKIEQEKFEAMLRVMQGHMSLDMPAGDGEHDVMSMVDMMPHPGMTPEETYARTEYEALMEALPFVVEEILIRSSGFSQKAIRERAIDIFHGRLGLNEAGTEVTLQELATKYDISAERVRQIHTKVLAVLAKAPDLQKYVPFLEEIRYQ